MLQYSGSIVYCAAGTRRNTCAGRTVITAEKESHASKSGPILLPLVLYWQRRFEKALNQFEHRDQVMIWRSYQLDPNAWDYAGNVNDLLARRYGMSREKGKV